MENHSAAPLLKTALVLDDIKLLSLQHQLSLVLYLIKDDLRYSVPRSLQ